MEQKNQEAPHSAPPLIAGLAGIAKNMFGLFLSRIELASLELAEVRAALLKLASVFALGLIAAWFAVAYWSALLVYLVWDVFGWKILFTMASGFTLITIGVVLYARAILAQGRLSMPATMNELRSDRDALLK